MMDREYVELLHRLNLEYISHRPLRPPPNIELIALDLNDMVPQRYIVDYPRVWPQGLATAEHFRRHGIDPGVYSPADWSEKPHTIRQRIASVLRRVADTIDHEG